MNLAAADNSAFTASSLTFLTAVGQQLGAAFERSQLQEQRTREIRYLAALEERQRLARDMHDSVTQLLFAADLALCAAEALDTPNNSVQQAHEAVQSALAELRSLVEVTRSADLSDGLANALSRLARRVSGQVKVHLQTEAIHLADTVENELYRIAQETLHNALRHANADNIWLELSSNSETATLIIRDDGAGFSSDVQGSGLESMRERAASLEGSLTIESSSTGTVLSVEVPWSTNS